MSVKISSESHTINIKENGAEISSVKNNNGLEYIWQGDEKIWGRHAPVLFPIVGKLRDNKFIYNSESFELPQHGFARDKKFELIQNDEKSCTFQLKQDSETKNQYPFDFILTIRYEIITNELKTSYTIVNPSKEIIYFSVGAHPGFKIPHLKTEKFEEYFLEFLPGDYNVTILKDGLLSEFKKKLPLENNRLQLNATLFDNDALVFENGQIHALSICKNEKPLLTIQCKNWPYFGIWSKKSCEQFVCLEPWHGITDQTDSNQQLADKKGIILLEAGKEFSCSFSVLFH
jgi:galactose mutarotase-like enzyme